MPNVEPVVEASERRREFAPGDVDLALAAPRACDRARPCLPTRRARRAPGARTSRFRRSAVPVGAARRCAADARSAGISKSRLRLRPPRAPTASRYGPCASPVSEPSARRASSRSRPRSSRPRNAISGSMAARSWRRRSASMRSRRGPRTAPRAARRVQIDRVVATIHAQAQRRAADAHVLERVVHDGADRLDRRPDGAATRSRRGTGAGRRGRARSPRSQAARRLLERRDATSPVTRVRIRRRRVARTAEQRPRRASAVFASSIADARECAQVLEARALPPVAIVVDRRQAVESSRRCAQARSRSSVARRWRIRRGSDRVGERRAPLARDRVPAHVGGVHGPRIDERVERSDACVARHDSPERTVGRSARAPATTVGRRSGPGGRASRRRRRAAARAPARRAANAPGGRRAGTRVRRRSALIGGRTCRRSRSASAFRKPRRSVADADAVDRDARRAVPRRGRRRGSPRACVACRPSACRRS